MTIFTFFLLLLGFAFLAGLIGALTGLGGGVVVTPVLVLIFHVDMHLAMGASLISVIATSSGAAAAYLREGYTNLRIGMFLETAAVAGAFLGALLIPYIQVNLLAVIFSLVLFSSAILTMRRKEEHDNFSSSHPWATALQLDGTYPEGGQLKSYRVQHVPAALSLMGLGGLLSGLLGIGSGAIKVLAMDHALRLPYKVSTTTSNFMIGITAAVSAGVYFSHGYINPAITAPVLIGVLAGSFSGAKILMKLHNRTLRIFFSVIICLIGLQMLYKAISGGL